MKKMTLGFMILIQISISCTSSSNTDGSNGEKNNINVTYSYKAGPILSYGFGNYSSKTIITSCNQTWMAENLKAIKYKNGDPIPEVSDPTAWAGLTTGAYCKYPSTNNVYGNLYNWYAVNDPRGLAPNGWHIPTKGEWINFADCLGGYLVAGEKMKEAGTSHWLSSTNPGNNISGFTAFGGGLRSDAGDFVNFKMYGFWWTSSESSATRSYKCNLSAISKHFCHICN